MTASDGTTRERPLCFVIGPFGADGSQTRKWSDFVFAKINVKDMACAGGGVGSISFEQNSRPFPVERGGRTVNVMIPGYKYTLRVAASRADEPSDSLARYVGTISHPRSQTLIGEAELTPRFLAVPA